MSQSMNETGAPVPGDKVPRMSLGAYLAEAGKALRIAIPKAWIEAVVLEARSNNGAMRLELVEPSFEEVQDGRSPHGRDGRLSATIWTENRNAIEVSLGMELDAALLKGARVTVLVQTTFHQRWHLGGNVLAFDPSIVAGIVQRKLNLIRKQLQAQGHWGCQRDLPKPLDVTAVAVIHPAGSAGWADVDAELSRLRDRGILSLSSYAVPFEGRGAAQGIANALKTIGTGPLPDIVLIIRGGGAASGLADLADLTLARAVCLCPVPIVTGIGHANDRTILDDCAWQVADTPSKALSVVKTILRKHYDKARAAHRAVLDTTAFRIGGTLQPLLGNLHETLFETAEALTARQASCLRDMAHGIERHLVAFRGTIDLTQAELDRVAGDLVAAAPAAPKRAARELTRLHAGLLMKTSLRLPDRDTLSAQAQRSAGLATTFVDRQASELRHAFAAVESAVRRRLGDETARLAAAREAAQAFDLEATLKRGFVLPLDAEHRIIRSTAGAKRAAGFELLFVDGQVKVHTDPRPTMP